jgi:hypothetical protein
MIRDDDFTHIDATYENTYAYLESLFGYNVFLLRSSSVRKKSASPTIPVLD